MHKFCMNYEERIQVNWKIAFSGHLPLKYSLFMKFHLKLFIYEYLLAKKTYRKKEINRIYVRALSFHNSASFKAK